MNQFVSSEVFWGIFCFAWGMAAGFWGSVLLQRYHFRKQERKAREFLAKPDQRLQEFIDSVQTFRREQRHGKTKVRRS